jgi:CRP/FNR family cyclic AMP-dependent transcriptional regulator
METLDFTKPSQSPVYDPAAATAFFKAAGTAETVASGKTFFVEQQKRGFFSADDRMYLVLEGEVNISIGGKSIDTVKAGEIFGEMATITNSPRSATATAKTDCRVIALDGKQFEKGIQKTPTFALMLMSIMIDRLRLTLARLTMMKTLPDDLDGDERRVFDDDTLDEIADGLGNPPLSIFAKGKTIITAGEAGIMM